MENGTFIGDLPIQIVIFHSYVELPEGRNIHYIAMFAHQQVMPPFWKFIAQAAVFMPPAVRVANGRFGQQV